MQSKSKKNNSKTSKKKKKSKNPFQTIPVSLLNEINKKLNSLQENLKNLNSEISKISKKSEKEKNDLNEKNKNIQKDLDLIKYKYEKFKKRIINLHENNKKVNLEIKKIDEEMIFFKKEAKEKFLMEKKIGNLIVENLEIKKIQKKYDDKLNHIGIKKLEEENFKLLNLNISLNNEIDQIEKDTKKFLKECEFKNKKNEILKKEILDLKNKKNLENEKINILNLEIKENEKEKKSLEKKFQNKKNYFYKKNLEYKKNFENLKQIEKVKKVENLDLNKKTSSIIQNLRKNPIGLNEKNNSISLQQEIIMNDLKQKNKLLLKKIQKNENEKNKLENDFEDFSELADKERKKFLNYIDNLYNNEFISKNKIFERELKKDEKKRVYNAKTNKNKDDLIELIESLIMDNLDIKKKLLKDN